MFPKDRTKRILETNILKTLIIIKRVNFIKRSANIRLIKQ